MTSLSPCRRRGGRAGPGNESFPLMPVVSPAATGRASVIVGSEPLTDLPVSEALANASKHARASGVSVRAVASDGRLYGVPFDGRNLLHSAPPTFDPAPTVEFLVGTVYAKILIWVAILALAIRVVRATPPARRILGPVFIAALLFAVHVALDSYYLRENTVPGTDAEFWRMIVPEAVLRAAIPLTFLAGLLHTRVTRSGVGELIVDLGRLPASGSVRDLLARALGDPSLRLGFWADGVGRYVDAAGHDLSLPGPQDAEVASYVDGRGGRLACSSTTPTCSRTRASSTPSSRWRAWPSRTRGSRPRCEHSSPRCAPRASGS